MKLKNISFGHHLKHATLPLFFLAIYIATVGLSLLSPFVATTYAAVENEEQQKNRTILYALRKCISDDKIFWKETVSGSDVNKSNISGIISPAFQSRGLDEIPVGYEIDSDNGNAKCNGISLNRALNFIDRTPDWFFGKIYDLDHPDQDGDKVIYHRRDSIFLLSNINTLLKAKDSAIGEKEKQRRLARAFWLCNEEVPDGQRPSRTNATIGGKKYQLREGKDSDNQISVGLDLEKTNGKYECGTLLKWGDKSEMAAALAAYPESAVGGGGGGGAGGGGAAGEVETGCEASGILAWLACPMTTAITTAADKLDTMINTLLTVNTRTLFCVDKSGTQCKDATDENVSSSKAYYKAWSSFRTIALGLIIIASLVVIISTAFGYEILDAYTIRKVLPRILIAVIFITLSWSVLDFLITLTNDVGNGIRSLIYQPFLDSGMEKTNINSFLDYGLGALLTGVGLLTLTPLGLLSFVVTALLAVLIAFFVLVLRELTIIMLVLLAPIAIACLVLPNTRKVWQLWQNTLTAMLVVFPIISAMIAAGRVFSVTTYTNDGDVINQVIALVAYILPYFLIPFAFRAAGGLMATIAGLANDRSRGAFDRLKKFREGEREYKKDRNQRRVIQARSNLNNKLQTIGSRENATWAGRRAARFGSKVVGGRNIEAMASAKRAAVAKEINDQIATGDDGEIRALSVDTKNAEQRVNNGVREYKTLGGAWVNEAQVARARQRWGNDSFAQQASLSYEMRKAATEEQLRGIAEGYPELAKSWGMNDDQATGAWIGAAFEHQNQHLEYKNMRIGASATGAGGRSMQMASDGYNNFVNEIYEKRGSYQMSQMGSNTIEELKKAHAVAVSEGNLDQQNKIAAIAETFMHEGGAPTQAGTAGGEDDGPPIMTAGGPRRQANTQGAGHVAERVRELAELTGIRGAGPTGLHQYGHTVNPDGTNLPNDRRQK